jgi:2-polyprenyl-3-methyl-5-hydroxy-6-metoxy-1,4-benzoquinol methylase
VSIIGQQQDIIIHLRKTTGILCSCLENAGTDSSRVKKAHILWRTGVVDKTSQSRMTGRFLSDRIRHWAFQAAAVLHLPRIREKYWNSRAGEIDRKWGTAKDDFAALRKVLESIAPPRLLDIGCGSGRLFPLYNQLQINEILGQDISRKALAIARKRYQFANITMTDLPILRLDYPAGYFDLIVSNRVLQHVPHDQIGEVIGKLTELGKHIYINETVKNDAAAEAFYLFKHDYRQLFGGYSFIVERQGTIGRQSWLLFVKDPTT